MGVPSKFINYPLQPLLSGWGAKLQNMTKLLYCMQGLYAKAYFKMLINKKLRGWGGLMDPVYTTSTFMQYASDLYYNKH